MREVVAQPSLVLHHCNPWRVGHIGAIGDEDRLIGLLLVKNEVDILEEMLSNARRWFDRILVLDGTTEQRPATEAILASFEEVVFIARDEDLLGTAPTRDGARQYLLDEARRRYGVDNWIGVLHADEFMEQDPRPMLASRHPTLDPSIRVRLVHAFLHVDDERNWSQLANLPVRDRLRYCMWPGVPEARFFFDAGDRDYEIHRHSKVIPHSFRPGPLIDGYTIVQFNERTPEQVIARANQRMADGWQTGHYARFADPTSSAFTDSLDSPSAPFAPEFVNAVDGPFVPIARSQVASGPQQGGPGPLFVTAFEAATARRGADALACRTGGQVLAYGLNYLTSPGGLTSLLDDRSWRSLYKFRSAMLTMTPRGERNWGFVANEGRTSPRRDYRAELDLLISILKSRRPSRQQRMVAIRQFVRRLHDRPRIDGVRWIDHGAIGLDLAATLLETFESADLLLALGDPMAAVCHRASRGQDPLEATRWVLDQRKAWLALQDR
ncbi:MAG: glycosyltransferase family 2 protein [Acidobacteria bacterium]|nr:glycosyltransferase family 2 protein [Acidobacteriota bacterium]